MYLKKVLHLGADGRLSVARVNPQRFLPGEGRGREPGGPGSSRDSCEGTAGGLREALLGLSSGLPAPGPWVPKALCEYNPSPPLLPTVEAPPGALAKSLLSSCVW